MTKQTKSPKTNAPEAANEQDQPRREDKHLYIKVDTYDHEDVLIGTRIVDQYHFGTRNWMQSHTWWAMQNNHTVVIDVATKEEVEAHLQAQREALAAKFNAAA